MSPLPMMVTCSMIEVISRGQCVHGVTSGIEESHSGEAWGEADSGDHHCPGAATLNLRPVTDVGEIRTKASLCPGSQGKSLSEKLSKTSSVELMGLALPFTTTLQATPLVASTPSASKATGVSPSAAASLVPSPVRKTSVPWSTVKFMGKMSGWSSTQRANRPRDTPRSNAQHSWMARISVGPVAGLFIMRLSIGGRRGCQ